MPLLSETNSHPRDRHITFQEEGHKYTLDFEPDIKYTSTTTVVHKNFAEFDADKIIEKMMNGRNWNEQNKYWTMTPEEIKEKWNSDGQAAARAGTALHREIECFYNGLEPEQPEVQDTPEWKYFQNFYADHAHLTPYRTEWLIFNEDIKVSGSIDMVFENQDGTLRIFDWKRSKQIEQYNRFQSSTNPVLSHLPDCNYWHYSLQLNIYKWILEKKYGKTVSDMVLVRLHPNAENYELYPVQNLTKEIDALTNQLLEIILQRPIGLRDKIPISPFKEELVKRHYHPKNVANWFEPSE